MKKVRNKTYLHKTSLDDLDAKSRSSINKAILLLPKDSTWNIIRLENNKIAFLYYPNFELDSHPSLQHSIIVDLKTKKIKKYTASKTNSPILHRKETFIDTNDQNYEKFSKLTLQEEAAGLLDPKISHKIGFKKYWEELLDKKRLIIISHQLKPKTQ